MRYFGRDRAKKQATKRTGRLVVGYFDFDLPQDLDDPFRTVFLPRHAPAPLVPVSLTFPLVQNSPVRSSDIFNLFGIFILIDSKRSTDVQRFAADVFCRITGDIIERGCDVRTGVLSRSFHIHVGPFPELASCI